ncbi:MAG: copper transporter [Dermatophilaceae bacterium]
MIDFRYHLVSIVSIFFALAVGIVLGAGPLQGQIGDTLNAQIAGLREDKDDLNRRLDQARAGTEGRDDYLAATSALVLEGVLRDRSVALVVLPGAESQLVEDMTETLRSSGARVVSTTTVGEDWVSADEGTTATRDAAVDQVARTARVDVSDTGSLAPRDVLLAALLVRPATEGDALEPAVARTGLEALAEAGVLSLEGGDTFEPAELVVVLSAAVPPADGDAATRAAERWVDLAIALDARSVGSLVAADVATEDDGVSVVVTLRDDATATDVVSTVDDVGDPMGRASVIHGLVQQTGGGVGQYGLGPGAEAPFAPVPAS